jgi:hypothetical protein
MPKLMDWGYGVLLVVGLKRGNFNGRRRGAVIFFVGDLFGEYL